ncbi:hypothetical protein AS159_03800 [Thermotoga sp. Ku-13t]|uniref:tripartite tricarboxylate transporter TctB family protein n=1 Tax=Thermotoga sp. Ku-13t TaxID=1755813 RepID=UPI0013EA15C9|nr:tripartite tricarboxylate transporter TctB family protein [Thermotoga sp. Ku-13t]KAF2958807.1 hypothetical protein AS159_03800 [Thermotoga sp. Ku-13t]
MVELVSAICFFVTGLAFLFESYKIRVLKFGGSLGGDFFPKFLSVMVIVISSMWVVSNLVKMWKKKQTTRLEFAPGGLRRIIIYLFGFIVYIVMLDLFGFFVPSIGVSLLTYLLLKERVKPVDFLTGSAYSLLVVTIIWFLFTKVLGLLLPSGRLV